MVDQKPEAASLLPLANKVENIDHTHVLPPCEQR